MRTERLDALVAHYLPVMITAGDFARSIQKGVRHHAPKAGDDPFGQALTDADLAVQTFFEISTRAHDPDLGFFGEEWARSPLHRYFAPDAETVIALDPINGTLLYALGLDGWDILLSVVHRRRLLAAVSYTPATGRFYIGRRDRGLVAGTRDAPTLGAMTSTKARGGSGVCLTYKAPDVLAAAEGAGLSGYDMVDISRPPPIDNLNDLFTGRLDAFACREAELIDWGAQAFLVAEGGGAVSHLDGSPIDFDDFDPRRQSDLLVCADASVHRALTRLRTPPAPSA